MNTLSTATTSLLITLLLALPLPPIHSQEKPPNTSAVVEGTLLDAKNQPIDNATLSLENENHTQKFATQSDPQGHFRFDSVPPGNYSLRAHTAKSGEKNLPFFSLHPAETKTLVLHLENPSPSATPADTLSSIPFSDEPQFTVAGVTDASNLGGHGSDTALRTKEALAKETASLAHESPNSSGNDASANAQSARMHASLGDIAEKESRPLEAVREYELAAKLNSSEAHLFTWGAELLLHRAFEPAIEVFTKGNRLHPTSARLLIGLGVATYDHGATERGQQLLLQACDVDPADPTPYLFLGKLQEAEKIDTPGWTEKLQRFVNLHPENAQAHYYYAVALGKQTDSQSPETLALREKELNEAISRDSKLGDAYLQLGILYSEKKDDSAAITALQKAIELTSLADEAHYRLAQLYRQSGQTEKARAEMAFYTKTSQQKKELAEQQRRELQQFVYTLHGQP